MQPHPSTGGIERQVKIDTEIRHVTQPGANLFLELGFPAEEAKLLQAASLKQVSDVEMLSRAGKPVRLAVG